MRLTKAHAAVLSTTTKDAVAAKFIYAMKEAECYRVAHALKEEDYVSVRVDYLDGWNKDTDTPIWQNLNKAGKLPSGTKPVLAYTAEALDVKPRVGECVIALLGDDEEGYYGVPGVVAAFTRGKAHVTTWNEEEAREEILKVATDRVLIPVGFARDYAMNHETFNRLHKTYGLTVADIEEVVDVLDAYELDIYDWVDYATSTAPQKTALFKRYVKPQEVDENGVLWSLFKNGEKAKAKYDKKFAKVAEEVDFEATVLAAKAAKIKEVYPKVAAKAKVADAEMETTVKGMKAHLVELCNTIKKQSLVLNLLK